MAFWGTSLFWVLAYLALVVTPLLVLLLGDTAAPGGLRWDFGITLGFAGATMMAAQSVLTARFKRLALPFGIDLVYYFHRYLAVGAFLVVLAHPVLLIADNPAVARLADPRTAPWHMTAGLVALAGFTLLMVTSLGRRALRIPYDPWRWLHALVAPVAIGCAVAHIHGVAYWVGAPWKRILWDGIGASVFALAVWVRLVRPWRLRGWPYLVTDVRRDRGDAWVLTLAPQGHRGIRFQPGQFAWLTLGTSPFLMREHPFSIASAPAADGSVQFAIKELGDFTRTIGATPRNTIGYVDGPYGSFSIDRVAAPGYCFIGGGIGVAPLLSMLRALADRKDRRRHWLILANSTWERVNLRDEVAALTPQLDLQTVHVLEEPPPGWTGPAGRLHPDLLDRLLPAERARLAYFVCGPTGMIEMVEHGLQALGVPADQCHSELFDLV